MIRREFIRAAASLPFCFFAVPAGALERILELDDTGLTAQARKLPAWFLSARVQGHTRLGPRWRNYSEYNAAGAVFKELGATVMTRHVKTADEPPSWPTAVGRGEQQDYARAMIAEAHTSGLRIITYYWDMSDADIEDSHPEWLCEDARGRTARHKKRGNFLDITSPYREVVLTRLLELADRGSDGFYFDHTHLPRGGCWSPGMVAEFQRTTGRRAPANSRDSDADYNAFLDFQAQRVADTFAYWQDQVHRKYPDVVFVVSTTFLPGLVSREMNTRLAAVVDSAKTEINVALQPGLNEQVFRTGTGLTPPRDDLRNAMGWALLRDAARGRPPHVWASGFPNVGHSRAFAGAVMTWGGIATIDFDEEDMLASSPAAVQERQTVTAAFALGKSVGPVLGTMHPLRWCAIHFPELARNKRGGDHVQAVRDVITPMTGAFGALVDNGLPVGIVTDDQLSRGELAEYSVLFLPAPQDLTAAQQQSVADFEERGGNVVRNAWKWADPKSLPIAEHAFLAAIATEMRDVPVRVTGLARGMHAVPFQNDAGTSIAVGVTNSFTWVQETGVAPLAKINAPPPAVSGIQVQTRGSHWSVSEAVSGNALRPTIVGGRTQVTLPSFDTFALVVFR